MLSWLLSYSFKQQRLENVPIERYKCGANIGGYKYDVSEIAALGKAYQFSDETKDYDYTVRLCDDLSNSQFPLGSRKQLGVNGIRINTQSHFVEPIAFHDTQDYDFNEASDPTAGFVISTFSQASDPESPYKWYKFTFVFMPGDDPSTDPIGDPMFFADGQTLNIALMFMTSYAKPTKVDEPPPPPLPPKCYASYQSALVYPYAIDFNLRNLNIGPHGFPIVFDEDPDTLGLYMPCGVSKCPFDFDCGADQDAAVWICKRNGMKCTAYATNVPNISVLYEDPDEGLRLNAKSDTDLETSTSVLCDFSLDRTKIWFDRAEIRDKTLSLRTHTSLACFRPIEPSTGGSCQATLKDDSTSLKIDLSSYNKDQGTVFDVTYDKWNKSQRHWMAVQPCDALPCPGDICPDSTGATIWVCHDNMDDTNVCYDYGLFRNLPEIEKFSMHLSQGVSVTYKGTDDRNTHLKITCNKELPKGQLIFSPKIGISHGDDISLYAQSSDVCVEEPPTMTPQPTVSPMPTATPGPQPGWAPPMPNARTQPVSPGITDPLVQASNGTHRVSFDLRSLTLEDGAMEVTKGTDRAPFKLRLHPFELRGAPEGWGEETPSGVQGDGWACFTPRGGSGPKCLPVMVGPQNGYDLRAPTHGQIRTVTASFEGYFDTRFEINFQCSKDPFALEGSVQFDGQRVYTATVKGSGACPQPISEPVFPPPPPSETPKPAEKDFEIAFEDDYHSYDLSKYGNITKRVYLRTEDADGIQAVDILLNPHTETACPAGAYCGGVERASAFKCWTGAADGKRYCLPIASTKYRPSVLNASMIVYEGGYAGYRTRLSLKCGRDTAGIAIAGVGSESADRVVSLDAISSDFCIVPGGTRRPTTPGAVFLTIVLVGGIAYVAAGALWNFVRGGVVALPQAAFWAEVGESVVEAFNAMTCHLLHRAGVHKTEYSNI